MVRRLLEHFKHEPERFFLGGEMIGTEQILGAFLLMTAANLILAVYNTIEIERLKNVH